MRKKLTGGIQILIAQGIHGDDSQLLMLLFFCFFFFFFLALVFFVFFFFLKPKVLASQNSLKRRSGLPTADAAIVSVSRPARCARGGGLPAMIYFDMIYF